MCDRFSKTLAVVYAQYLESPRNACSLQRIPQVMLTSVLVHERDAKAGIHEIPRPKIPAVCDDSDNDDSRFGRPDLTWLMFVVTRRLCMSSCCTIVRTERVKELLVPNALRWRTHMKVPDACPVCHKVLFLKTRRNHGQHTSQSAL